MIVKFIFSKTNQSTISLDYQTFDNVHSQLWLQGIREFINSKQQLVDVDRVYNFNDYHAEFKSTLYSCNQTIIELNKIYNLSINPIREQYLQEDINYVHTFFVESDRHRDNNSLWPKLNELLHGLEIIERSKKKSMQGQVFCSMPNAVKYDLPEESYKYFTTKKQFGYCYANYPHVGRHILEMFNARDEHANDEDIIPMHKIAGDFYLWFGNNTPGYYDIVRKWNIRRWFKKESINKIVGMEWGNPRLAIGWLPVAKILQPISKQSLVGLKQLDSVQIV